MHNRLSKHHTLASISEGEEYPDTLWRLPRKKEWLAVILPFVCCSICLFLLNSQSDEPFFIKRATEWSMEDAIADIKIARTGETLKERYQSEFLHDKGYVMCVGDESSMISDALFTIQSFRTHWKSVQPISIAHCSELSTSNLNALTDAHDDAVREAQLLDGKGGSPELHILDLCRGAPAVKKRRLRGWFCKTAALVTSSYRHTMLIDTDLVWFQNPDLLFTAPAYINTGALFFRDRLMTQPPSTQDGAGWALQYHTTVNLINHQRATSASNTLGKVISDDPIVGAEQARVLAENGGNGVNYFWRYGYDALIDQGLAHNQESSVVILDKQRNHRTVAELRRLVSTFNLGYGDKEVYWIAAIIAGDSHAWEPYLQGAYGNCGPILHFNPDVDLKSKSGGSDADRESHIVPYFVNGQFLVEGVHRVGEGVEQQYTRPIRAKIDTLLTGCSCEATGGCVSLNIEQMTLRIHAQQRFMLDHTGQPPSKFTNRFRKFMKRFYNRFLPSWMN